MPHSPSRWRSWPLAAALALTVAVVAPHAGRPPGPDRQHRKPLRHDRLADVPLGRFHIAEEDTEVMQVPVSLVEEWFNTRNGKPLYTYLRVAGSQNSFGLLISSHLVIWTNKSCITCRNARRL